LAHPPHATCSPTNGGVDWVLTIINPPPFPYGSHVFEAHEKWLATPGKHNGPKAVGHPGQRIVRAEPMGVFRLGHGLLGTDDPAVRTADDGNLPLQSKGMRDDLAIQGISGQESHQRQ
jgi:hypothetical protein